MFNSSDYDAIIFDFDGTLVDSEPVWKSTFYDVFKEDYGVELSQQILWENTGVGVDLSVLDISNKLDLGMDNNEIQDMAEKLHQIVLDKILSELELREGAIKLFEFAQSNNIHLAICTASTTELINSYFKKYDMRDIFSVVFSTVDLGIEKRKPHPFPYVETMRMLAVKPERTLAFEDSCQGITSAMDAQIDTVAIQNQFINLNELKAQPKFVAQDFLQVLELFSTE